MGEVVNVKITNKGAIYVDDTRITNRNTKWGCHNIVEEFDCPRSEVRERCLFWGYDDAVRNIDIAEFME